MRGDRQGRPYTIHLYSGQGNLREIVDDLARQAVQKNVDDFGSKNPRVKKTTVLGRAG